MFHSQGVQRGRLADRPCKAIGIGRAARCTVKAKPDRPQGNGHGELHTGARPQSSRPDASQQAEQVDNILTFPTAATAGQDNWRTFRARLVNYEARCTRGQRGASGAERPSALQRPRPPPAVCAPSGSYAHLIRHIEPGCLLLARQPHMGFFAQSVVLVTSHDDVRGTLGYVINRASPMTAAGLPVSDDAKAFKTAFAEQRLCLGGPVHLDQVTLLHNYRGLARSQEVAEGVYLGGLPSALELVNTGLAKPDHFRLMLGMSGWAPKQLEAEISRGLWWVVSASPDLCLPMPQRTPTPVHYAPSADAFTHGVIGAPDAHISSGAPSSSSSSSSGKPASTPGVCAPSSPPVKGKPSDGMEDDWRAAAAAAAVSAAVALNGGSAAGTGAGVSGGAPSAGPPGGVTCPLYRKIAKLALRGF